MRQITAARLVKGSTLHSKRIKCGKADRILVDANLCAILRTAPGKIFRKREAAKRLGISVSVLQALKEAGIYEVNNFLPTRAGFHERDLKAFIEKLFALALEPNSRDTTGIAFLVIGETRPR